MPGAEHATVAISHVPKCLAHLRELLEAADDEAVLPGRLAQSAPAPWQSRLCGGLLQAVEMLDGPIGIQPPRRAIFTRHSSGTVGH